MINDLGALSLSRERPAATASGYPMLLVMLVALAGAALGLMSIDTTPWGWIAAVVGMLAFLLVLPGFYMLQPNQAAAITLFGSYKGTDRTPGLRWVLPWLIRRKISARANNITSELPTTIDPPVRRSPPAAVTTPQMATPSATTTIRSIR